jgi:lysophospholipase L1-like esterase
MTSKKNQPFLYSLLTIALGAVFFMIIYGLRAANEHYSEIPPDRTYDYLALGDSYTIGESVESNKTWPILLSNSLADKKMSINTTMIIAKTGWRTDQMLAAAEEKVQSQKFDMISLLIGVNNEFQGQDPGAFEKEFIACLTYAIAHCRSGKDGVFVVSIPDYGYTPYGANQQGVISKRIDQYNEICERIATNYQIPFYDITPISRRGLEKPKLVASDGLHPSAKQYQLWVDHFSKAVYKQFNP